jgi:hypothetical protein
MPSDDDVNGKLDTLIDKVDNIETLLVGDVRNSGKIGILERVRQIEKWIAKREWFEKLIIIAIVGNAIGLIFLLIQNSLGY